MERVVMEKIEENLVDSTRIPESLFGLFWELEPETIHIVRHGDFVMGRIMERGNWEAMRWLLKTYSKKQLASFLKKRGRRILPPRELNYWSLITGIAKEKRTEWVRESRENNSVWSAKHAH